MICSYCQTENNDNAETCGFCAAPLRPERPQLKDFVFLDQCKLPFTELQQFHTYDLLVLLRLVREERTSVYNLMRMGKKLSLDSDSQDFSEEEYRHFTARMKVIEGILIDRMGYKPKRVDNKLLARLAANIQNQNTNK